MIRPSPLVAFVLVTATASIVAACSFDVDHYDGDYVKPLASTTSSSRPSAPLPKGPAPDYGVTIRAAVPPPPISGGTLLVMRSGHVVAADPDRDRIFVVNVETREVKSIALFAGDEPGRVVEDAEGRVHVVLRRGGAIVTIDPMAAHVLARRAVCPSPRGIALSVSKEHVLVACEGGELAQLSVDPAAAKPDATLVTRLDNDLRDLVVTRDRVFVSRMRSAEILELSPSFGVIARSRPTMGQKHRPMLAMRMIAPPEGDPVVDPILVHEVSRDPAVGETGAPSYQGVGGRGIARTGLECGETAAPVVLSSVSRLGIGQGSFRAPDLAALPVDVAADARTIAIVAAGNGHTRSLPQIYTFANMAQAAARAPLDPVSLLPCPETMQGYRVHGQAVAVAFRRPDALVVQSREPAELELLPEKITIPLSAESREDTGHAIFHSSSGAGIACASCHVEGGDDGQVWTVDKNGPLRTPSLRGTLAGTAPFHWRGDIPDISSLADTIMTGRMNGPSLHDEQKGALEAWLFTIPAPNVAKLGEAAARGRVLFERSDVACASCHSGPRFTSSATRDVGTGGAFQVPSLVGVSTHAPYLHDGCAATLRDRFGACGGDRHGDISRLTSSDLDDLTSYLETL